jgi:hypothetical protein
MSVPTEMLTKPIPSEPATNTQAPRDEVREWAREHVEHVRKLKRNVAIYLLGITTLSGIWALAEWQDHGGLERLSGNGNPGDWEPWIFYVAAIWGFFVVLDALKVYFDRPTTQTEIDRAVDRLERKR